MASLAAQYTLSQTPGVQQAIRMAMIKNAEVVVSEAADVARPNRHLKRHNLAVSVLQDPDYWLMRFVYAIAAKDTLTVSSLDAAILSEVGTLFELISGVDITD